MHFKWLRYKAVNTKRYLFPCLHAGRLQTHTQKDLCYGKRGILKEEGEALDSIYCTSIKKKEKEKRERP